MRPPYFSIVTCAYNPLPEIFDRLLKAVVAIGSFAQTPEFEIIIVDNNSSPALETRPQVQDFLTALPHARLIRETKPGLTNARIAGVNAAKADWIIFFDDDNEPHADYLTHASRLIQQHPNAGVLGPGNITVHFLGTPAPFALEHKFLFQERKFTQTTLDNVRWGQTAYPIGTGMIVRRDILQAYMANVASGQYTMTDRIGNSLISGGDIQILLTGIKIGWYAGSSPDLKLNHLISERKSSYRKMLQLIYMTSASAVRLYNEVFPDEPHPVVAVGNKRVLEVIYTQIRLYLFKEPWREVLFQTVRKLGELYAQVLAAPGAKPPLALRTVEKLLF